MNNWGVQEGSCSSKSAEPTTNIPQHTPTLGGRDLLGPWPSAAVPVDPAAGAEQPKLDSSSAGCEAGCIAIAGNAAWIDRPWQGYEGERSEPE